MITRSLGISPGLPWGGPLPGGGYDGKTKRLDRAVQRFAEWLHRRIAGPVQVRFNSHRLSGGAFVYPGLDADARITFRHAGNRAGRAAYHARERTTAARSGLGQRGRGEPAGLGMGGLLDRSHAAVLQRAGLSRVPAQPERPGRIQAGRQVRLLERRHAARGIPAIATTYRERSVPCPIMR